MSAAVAQSSTSGGDVADPNVQFDGTTQVINLKVTGTPPYYAPSDTYTVKAGVPVHLVVSGTGTGCRSVFQIPKLGQRIFLDGTQQALDFTPTAGTYAFSCSMGMFRGTLNVI